jgi:hypothetical protein
MIANMIRDPEGIAGRINGGFVPRFAGGIIGA